MSALCIRLMAGNVVNHRFVKISGNDLRRLGWFCGKGRRIRAATLVVRYWTSLIHCRGGEAIQWPSLDLGVEKCMLKVYFPLVPLLLLIF
jgi:hypothetical protein